MRGGLVLGHVEGMVGTRGGAGRWVPVGGYTGYYPAVPTQRLIGIARAQPMPLQRVCAHPRALQAPPGPSAHPWAPRTQYASWSQIRRDSALNILKLV